jgi:hypothetical protein
LSTNFFKKISPQRPPGFSPAPGVHRFGMMSGFSIRTRLNPGIWAHPSDRAIRSNSSAPLRGLAGFPLLSLALCGGVTGVGYFFRLRNRARNWRGGQTRRGCPDPAPGLKGLARGPEQRGAPESPVFFGVRPGGAGAEKNAPGMKNKTCWYNRGGEAG